MEQELKNAKIGMPKSGMPWKIGSQKSSAKYALNKGLILTWEQKEKIRQQKKQKLEIIRQIQQETIQKKRDIRQKTLDRKQIKEKNQFKSAEFKIISDTKKIKKWNKKARSQLAKLPVELFEKVVHGKK